MRLDSAFLIVRLAAKDVAMFRFLLEAHENLACFSVLEKRPTLLKLMFAAESRDAVLASLTDIGRTISLEWSEWPFPAKHQTGITDHEHERAGHKPD